MTIARPSRLRDRLLGRTLSEFHAASRVFAPFGHVRKVAFFGSARTESDHVEYALAIRLAGQFVENDFMVITGAGPGIMAAAQKGAGANNSFGLRILLPFHNPANDTIADDSKLVEFEYYGNLEKSRISHLQKLTKKRLAAPKGLINCTSK